MSNRTKLKPRPTADAIKKRIAKSPEMHSDAYRRLEAERAALSVALEVDQPRALRLINLAGINAAVHAAERDLAEHTQRTGLGSPLALEAIELVMNFRDAGMALIRRHLDAPEEN